MPQEHHVLKCFSCETFQVHIVKKSNQWECKVCGAKQSVKRNYGKGSGKECRLHVMKLNELKMLKDEVPIETDDNSFDKTLTDKPKEQEPIESKPKISKWAQFLDSESDTDTEVDCFENFQNEIVSKKRKKSIENCNARKKSKSKGDLSNTNSKHSNELLELTNDNSEINKKSETKENYSMCHLSNKKESKYSMYLDEDESDHNNDLSCNVKTSSNIFDSDPTDLESILSF